MNKCRILGLVILILMGWGTTKVLTAQVQLPSEEVQVVRDFDARLASTERLLLNPEMPPMDTTKLAYNFAIQGRQLEYDYQPPQIRALGMGRADVEPSYSSYLRAGYGVPNSPLADAYTHFGGENYSLYADGQHYSVNNRNSIENQIVGRTHIGLGGEYVFSPSFAVKSNLNYDNLINDLYGYDSEVDSFSQEEAARRFNRFQADISFLSKENNSWGLGYQFTANYQRTSDNVMASENKYDLSTDISWNITEKQSFTLGAKAVFINFSDSITEEQNLNIYALNPKYSYTNGRFLAEAGVYFGSGNGTFIFPDIHLEYGLLEDQVIAYAGSSGSIQGQGFSLLTERNPYFINTMDSLYTLEEWRLYAGAKGRYQKLTYALNLAYQNFTNLAFFTPAIEDSRVFSAIYEDGNTFDISLSLQYPITEKLTTSLLLNKKFISLDSLAEPIHTPTFTIDLRTEYVTLSDNLQLWLDVRYQNGVNFIDTESQFDQLGSLFDVSLGADYYFSKHWGVFVHGYNLANNTRQRWNQYPIIGRNILGGIIMRF